MTETTIVLTVIAITGLLTTVMDSTSVTVMTGGTVTTEVTVPGFGTGTTTTMVTLT